MYLLIIFIIVFVIFLYICNYKNKEIESFESGGTEQDKMGLGGRDGNFYRDLNNMDTDISKLDNEYDGYVSGDTTNKTPYDTQPDSIDTQQGINDTRADIKDTRADINDTQADMIDKYEDIITDNSEQYQEPEPIPTPQPNECSDSAPTPDEDNESSNMQEVLGELSNFLNKQNNNSSNYEETQCLIIPSNGNNICPADNNFFRGFTKCNIKEQAKAYPIVQNGQIVNILMVKPGKSYNKNVLITFKDSGNGRGCKLQPEICNGEIVKINIVNPGINYSEDTKLIISKPNNTDCKICCNYPYNQNL